MTSEEVKEEKKQPKLSYEDIRVLALEKKGPIPPVIKEVIRAKYSTWEMSELRWTHLSFKECNKKRQLDKFERCEWDIVHELMMEQWQKSSATSKKGCTLV